MVVVENVFDGSSMDASGLLFADGFRKIAIMQGPLGCMQITNDNRSIRVGWIVCKGFLLSSSVQAFRRLVLASMVQNKKLNNQLAKYGRMMMSGAACHKFEDGEVRGNVPSEGKTFKGVTNIVVWRWLNLVPIEVELKIRRLKWFQDMCRDVGHHSMIFLVMINHLEVHGDIKNYKANKTKK